MQKDPVAVTVDGKRYDIVGRLHSGSRGHEFQLRDPESNLLIRVCWAPSPGVRAGAVHTSGNDLVFIYS